MNTCRVYVKRWRKKGRRMLDGAGEEEGKGERERSRDGERERRGGEEE